MESINSKMNSEMTNNVKDIISGAFRFKSTYEDRVYYILSRMKSSYPSILWTISIFDQGYSYASYSNNNYFFCIIDGLCVSISGYNN